MGKNGDRRLSVVRVCRTSLLHLVLRVQGQDFVAGGAAGLLARTATAPLDLVKIQAQVGTSQSKQGFLRSFPTVWQQEGLRGFWKGNLIACIRLFPFSGIQFATNTKCRWWFSDLATGRVSPMGSFLAGAISGVVASAATYPVSGWCLVCHHTHSLAFSPTHSSTRSRCEPRCSTSNTRSTMASTTVLGLSMDEKACQRSIAAWASACLVWCHTRASPSWPMT
jgi:hypothetical protein